MAYTDFTITAPAATQTPGAALTSARENLLAMRDALIGGAGLFPGWNCQAQNANGTSPPTDPTKPAQYLWSKGTERIKMALTWGTTGGAADQVTRVVISYSADSGATYDIIKGDTSGGYYDSTYDSEGNWISGAWS